jgi:hypothetical protein
MAFVVLHLLDFNSTNWLLGPSDLRLRLGLPETTYARGRAIVKGKSTGKECRLVTATGLPA